MVNGRELPEDIMSTAPVSGEGITIKYICAIETD